MAVENLRFSNYKTVVLSPSIFNHERAILYILRRRRRPSLFIIHLFSFFIRQNDKIILTLCFCKKMQKSPVPMKGTRENPRGATLFQEPKLSSKAPQSGAV